MLGFTDHALAKDVSLRWAWKTITATWPGRLSDAATHLETLTKI
jgi:hypothetical protein